MPQPAEMCTVSLSALHEDGDLRARVSAEFRELPGLKLTVRQAARLFSQDSAECERALGALVERGELATDGEAFALARADTHAPPHRW